jgi:hypothetical protein
LHSNIRSSFPHFSPLLKIYPSPKIGLHPKYNSFSK